MTTPAEPWPYSHLDPDAIRRKAYQLHCEGGGCMHAVSRSIIESQAVQLGEPYNSFPYHVLVYGYGGFVGQGSLCGAVNGAVAAISLFCVERPVLHKLSNELLRWCRTEPLPRFVPDNEGAEAEGGTAGTGMAPGFPLSVCDSLDCRDMLKSWQQAVRESGMRASRSDRCHRLSADLAGRTVEILNSHFA